MMSEDICKDTFINLLSRLLFFAVAGESAMSFSPYSHVDPHSNHTREALLFAFAGDKFEAQICLKFTQSSHLGRARVSWPLFLPVLPFQDPALSQKQQERMTKFQVSWVLIFYQNYMPFSQRWDASFFCSLGRIKEENGHLLCARYLFFFVGSLFCFCPSLLFWF